MWWKVLAAVGILGILAAMALPMATLSIKVDLPPAVPAAPTCKTMNLRVAAKKNGPGLWLNGRLTGLERLLLDLSKSQNCAAESTPVIIKADSGVRYGDFKTLKKELEGGGFIRIYLVTEGPAKQPK